MHQDQDKENFKQKMVIYKATNVLNGKIYIGKTELEFKRRLNQYRSNSFNCNNTAYNLYICRAIRKYGWENFKWEIIDTAITAAELIEKEIYWIKYFNSFGSGYNMTKGGEGTKGYKHDEEKRMQIAISHGAKPFMLFTLEGAFFKEFLSKSHCSRELGIASAVIIDALNNKITHAGGFIVVLRDEYSQWGYRLVREKINLAKMSNRGSNRFNATLKEEDVIRIKHLLIKGIFTFNEIAEKFGVSRGVIGAISRGRDWRHVEVRGFTPKLSKPSKLKDVDIIKLKEMLRDGIQHRIIAEKFNVNPSNISMISTGKTWSHVEVEGFTPIIRKGGELSPSSKLTKEVVIEIKKMLEQGINGNEIARIFNINKSAVYDIKQGRTWKEID